MTHRKHYFLLAFLLNHQKDKNTISGIQFMKKLMSAPKENSTVFYFFPYKNNYTLYSYRFTNTGVLIFI